MLSVKTNIDSFIKTTLANHRKQIQFAKVLANTRTAQAIKKAQTAEIRKVFDAPTNYTLKAVEVRNATKSVPEARVKLIDYYGKGNPQVDVLYHHVWGGKRVAKRFEKRLREKGLLSNGSYVVPAGGVRLNKNGNVTGGQITQILSVVGAHTEAGFTANTTTASRKRNKKLPNIFIVKENASSNLAPGIWKRRQRSIVPMFFFVNNVSYRRRFDFYGIAQAVAQQQYPAIYDQALKDAKASAR